MCVFFVQFNEEARSPFVKKFKTIIHPGEVSLDIHVSSTLLVLVLFFFLYLPHCLNKSMNLLESIKTLFDANIHH